MTDNKVRISVHFPNPFNSSCAITAPAGAVIEIFDLRGRLVNKPSDAFGATFLDKGGTEPVPLNKGGCREATGGIIWQPDQSTASGIYLVRARTGDGRAASKKVVFMK
jgi:hypothetical protein